MCSRFSKIKEIIADAVMITLTAISSFGLATLVIAFLIDFKWYYAFYSLSLGDLIDGYIFLLIGFLLGALKPEVSPRGFRRRVVFISLILVDFFSVVFLKLLFYFSPILIIDRYGYETFQENIKILTNASLYELEQVRALITITFAQVILPSSLCLMGLIAIMLFRGLTEPSRDFYSVATETGERRGPEKEEKERKNSASDDRGSKSLQRGLERNAREDFE